MVARAAHTHAANQEVEVEDETAWDPSNLEESMDVAPQNGESEGLWSAFKEKEQLLREKVCYVLRSTTVLVLVKCSCEE